MLNNKSHLLDKSAKKFHGCGSDPQGAVTIDKITALQDRNHEGWRLLFVQCKLRFHLNGLILIDPLSAL